MEVVNKHQFSYKHSKYLLVYIIIVLALSFLIRTEYVKNYLDEIFVNARFLYPDFIFNGLTVFVPTLIFMKISKVNTDNISFFGKKKLENILLYISTIITLILANLYYSDAYLLDELYTLLLLSLYVFSEEYGWRMYVQNELIFLKPVAKYIILGVLWWLWHFRFGNGLNDLTFLSACLFGGLLLGYLTDKTHSIISALSLHVLVTSLTSSTSNTGVNAYLVFNVVILNWVIISIIFKNK